MTNFKGLYFPYIHFKSEYWVKLNALYWDEMGRIVPEGMHPWRDQADVAFLAQKRVGFVRDLIPKDYTLSKVSAEFVMCLKQHEAALRTRYSLSTMDSWKPVSNTARYSDTAQHTPAEHDPRLEYVAIGKLHPDLHQALKDSGFASLNQALPERRFANAPETQWVSMHPFLADVYMLALAQQMARDEGLRPATDEEIDHVASTTKLAVEDLATLLLQPEEPRLLPSVKKLEHVMMSIAVHYSRPKAFEQLTGEAIVKFREEYESQRHAFQEAWRQLAEENADLVHVKTEKQLKECLNAVYEKKVASQFRDYEEAMRAAAWETEKTLIASTLKIPVALATLASGDFFTGFATIGNAAVEIWSAVTEKSDPGEDRPFAAYLVPLANQLAAVEEAQRPKMVMTTFGFVPVPGQKRA